MKKLDKIRMETYSTAVLVVAVAVVLVVVRHDEELIVWICLCNSDVWILGAYLYTHGQGGALLAVSRGQDTAASSFPETPTPAA